MMESWLWVEVRADQQDVVVGVCGRQHMRGGRAELAGSVDPTGRMQGRGVSW